MSPPSVSVVIESGATDWPLILAARSFHVPVGSGDVRCGDGYVSDADTHRHFIRTTDIAALWVAIATCSRIGGSSFDSHAGLTDSWMLMCHTAVTSSEQSHARSATDGDVRIDTIRFRGRIHELPPEQAFSRYHRVNTDDGRSSTTALRTTMGSGIPLLAGFRGGLAATIEVSVPRYLGRSNVKAATLAETRDTIHALYEEASSWVDWHDPLGEVRIIRLDSVRDFQGVTDVSSVLEGLRHMRLPYNPLTSGWDEELGKTNSLRRYPQSRTWVARLYDKHLERSSNPSLQREMRAEVLAASLGVLRYELLARSSVMKRHGLVKVSDLSQIAVRNINLHYFKRSGFDREIGGGWKVKEVVLQAIADGNGKPVAQAVQMLLWDSLGLPPAQSPRTQHTLKKLVRRYGLESGDLFMNRDDSLRLDYETASLVRRGPGID